MGADPGVREAENKLLKRGGHNSEAKGTRGQVWTEGREYRVEV